MIFKNESINSSTKIVYIGLLPFFYRDTFHETAINDLNVTVSACNFGLYNMISNASSQSPNTEFFQ